MSTEATSVKKFTFDLNKGGLGPMEIIQKDKSTPTAEQEIIDSNEDAQKDGGKVKPEEQKVNPVKGKEKSTEVPSGRNSDPDGPIRAAEEGLRKEEAEDEADGDSASGDAQGGGDGSQDDGDEQHETENIGFYLAKQLQVEGYISEDFDPSEDISRDEVYQAVRDGLYETIQSEAISDLQQRLQREGVTREMLTYARAIQNGIDLQTLNAASVHTRFAKMELSEDLTYEDKVAAIKAMHSARGLSEKDSDRLISSSENAGELDADFKESTSFHKTKVKEFEQQEARHAEEIEKERKRVEILQINAINKAVQQRNILSQTLTPEQAGALRDDIYTQNQVVNIGGQSYNASAYQSWLYQFENDPEVKLHAFISYKYRDRAQEVAEAAAKAKIEKNFLDDYTVLSNKKETKKQTDKTEKKEAKKAETPKTNRKISTVSLF